jgi:starvation-inducible DNA-binding protein
MPETVLANETLETGVQSDKRSKIVETLNRLLADEHVLYVKTRNYHWNVRSHRFNDLHKFFEEQYTQLALMIDEIAEQARQFGGFATGTMTEFVKSARLKEKPGEYPDPDTMVRNLMSDHEHLVRELRPESKRADEELEVPEAGEFLRSVLQTHNKMAWMLRSFLADQQ